MPFCFEEKDVLSELAGCNSALIVPCRFCPAASAAVKNDKPYLEPMRRLMKTESYERQISTMQSRLGKEGIKTEVFKSTLVHQFVLCMWTGKRRRGLREVAKHYDAVIVMGCEAAVETVNDALKTNGCRVVQGLETEGIMNVLPKFSWPGSIWLQLESVTRASLEHRAPHRSAGKEAIKHR